MLIRSFNAVAVALACSTVGVVTSTAGSSYAADAGGLPMHVNSCWTTDNGAPVVDSFSLSTHAVDVTDGPATVTITVDAHDTGGPGPASGLTSVRVQMLTYWADSADSGKNDAGGFVRLHRDGADWVGTYTIPRDAHQMQVRAGAVDLDAAKGPLGSYDPSSQPGSGIVDVTSAHPDTSPPTLTDLTLSTGHVDVSHAGRDVHITAQVEDATGLAEAKLFAQGQVPDSGAHLTPTGTPGEVGGTLHVSRWIGARHLPLYLALTDSVGNEGTVSPHDLAVLGLPTQIRVTGSPRDAANPRVRSVGGGPHRVHVRRAHAHWNIRVHATDIGSGVGTVDVRPPGVVDQRHAPRPIGLHLVSGNRHDGVWGARLPIRRCVAGPGRTSASLTVTDRTGRYSVAYPLGPRLIGPDHTPPGVTAGRGDGTVGLEFNEPVHGISRRTTQVISYETPDETRQVLHGSWTCRNVHRTVVSCRKGAVREATFDYTGFQASYVDLEPDGHLDVLDRHGNPVAGGGVTSLDEG